VKKSKNQKSDFFVLGNP